MLWSHKQTPRTAGRPWQKQHATTAAAGNRRVPCAHMCIRHAAPPRAADRAADTLLVSQPIAVPDCGLLGADASVDTPSAYLRQWRAAVKPHLDGLWGSVLKTSNAERLLFNLDALLMQLRSSQSLAVHLQQQHQDPAWAEAAAQVAADCQKYEAYVHGSQSLAAKLNSTRTRLLQQLQDSSHHTTTSSSSSGGTSANLQQQRSDLQLQLRLCNVLSAAISGSLPSDSLQWLAALELPDPAAVALQQQRQRERELVAAIDTVVNKPVLLELPAPVTVLLADVQQQQQQQHVSAPHIEDTANSINSSSNSAAGDAQETGTHQPEVNPQQQPADQQQLVLATRGMLVQLLQRCSDSSVRQQAYFAGLLPRLAEAAALLDELARCRHYQAQLIGCSSYLQQTQQRLADVSSSRSSSSSSSSSTDQTYAVSGSAVDFLLQLAEALKPLAAREVQSVLRQGKQQTQQQQQGQQQQHVQAMAQVASQQQQTGAEEQSAVVQQQQQQQQLDVQAVAQDASQQQQKRAQEQSATPQQQQQQQEQQEQGGLSSWEWDYQLHRAQAPLLQQLQDPALQQHMHLESVLRGFSRLLQRLLGVQLLLRPAGQAEVWGQHVKAVMVVRQQQQQQEMEEQQAAVGEPAAGCSVELLGTVYLDVGGGYGTRVLRYTREEELARTGSSNSSSDVCRSNSNVGSTPSRVAAVSACAGIGMQWQQLHVNLQQQLLQQFSSAVAVAVGISGSRITLLNQATQRQQQQPRLLQEQPGDDDETIEVAQPGNSSCCSSSSGALVLGVSQLWELGHEMGHALHLVLSSRQPACHLSGRFLPPSLLEVPSQLFERLFTSPANLAQLCRHHGSAQPLPPHLADALASYYRQRYASPLALSARAAAGLAEQMYGKYGDDAVGCGIWRGSWGLLSGLPRAVAAAGSLRELSLLPVLAASNGTYHCYLISWCIAARLAEQVFEPLLQQTSRDASNSNGAAGLAGLQVAAASVMGVHAGMSRQELVCQLRTARGLSNVGTDAFDDQLLEELAVGGAGQLKADLQRWLCTPE